MGRRIALVCDWYSPRRGGIEAHLDGLATRLVARGHFVTAITSTPGPSEVNGIPVHRLDVPLIPFAGVAASPVARDVAGILEREQVDLVHSHVSIVAPVALGGARAAARLRLPSVLTFHSFVPATPVLARLAGWILGASKWPAEMTAVSRRVAREVKGFASSDAFSILPNAIDTSFWTPGAPSAPNDPIRLVFVGRLQAKKRPLLLLRVLRELERTCADLDWSLAVVGDGPLGERLRQAVRRLGLGRRVQFMGWVDRNSLRELLRTSAAFLSTATRESFGLAALEARACGLPVVAVGDSAVADFISHEVSGLLAETDEAFAAAAARLVRDGDLRARIADFNRRTPVTYDWESSLLAHEAVYAAAARRVRR